jgi:hypothetical protein
VNKNPSTIIHYANDKSENISDKFKGTILIIVSSSFFYNINYVKLYIKDVLIIKKY